MIVRQLTPEEWAPLSEEAHGQVFGTHKPQDWDRIDFVLVYEEENKMVGYVTCREFDAHTLYWQFGGALPDKWKTSSIIRGYLKFLEWTRKRYKRVTTVVENTNRSYLNLTNKFGFMITGIRYHEQKILLELVLEFKENENA